MMTLKLPILVTVAHVLMFTAPTASGHDDVILPPTKSTGEEIALLWIQGAECPAPLYLPIVQRIQAALPYRTWVGIPAFALNTPEPLVIGTGIDRVLKNMTAQGMNTDSHFFGAHSLGGVILQDWLAKNTDKVKGQILTGAFLVRKYANKTYPVKTLTIGGELDGLCRVTRIAEAFYRYVSDSGNPSAVSDFPVVVLPGVSHNQFASGAPPPNVKKHDLKPEVSYDQAHDEIANVSAAFIQLQMGDSSKIGLLKSRVQETATFVKPIVASQLYEGSYHLHPPCNNNGFKEFPCTAECSCGSRWTEQAQSLMAGLNSSETATVTDEFHPVWQVLPRVHLPHVWNNCTEGQAGCDLNITTVTQAVYSKLDKFDTGFYPTAAIELRAKLVSRQWAFVAAGDRGAKFNVTDAGNLCADLNRASYQWALEQSGQRSKSRFAAKGQQLVMGPDKLVVGGPAWIWQALAFNTTADNKVMVTSIAQKTPLNYFLKIAAGFHYCKLLSPARAVEWIYLDGLRAAMHL